MSYDRFIPRAKPQMFLQPKLDSNYQELLYNIQAPSDNVFSQIQKICEQRKIGDIRQIPTAPERILDAPELADDFYLNILDWGQNNILAVGLTNRLYLWDVQTSKMIQYQYNQSVNSVHWLSEQQIALGVGNETKILDIVKNTEILSQQYHLNRVSALTSSYELLTSSGRDCVIHNRDLRQNKMVNSFIKHTQEVCGLKWNPSGSTLSSGANDNQLLLWDRRQMELRTSLLGHTAAVKAMSWCPWTSSTLASGGGSHDRSLKLWNVETGCLVKQIDTGSQVCALEYLPRYRELLTSHGFSQFQVQLWKADQLQPIQELKGHKSRVLHMSVSPDQSMLCTAAGDETLVFWRLGTELPNPTPQSDDSFQQKNLLIR